MDTTYLYYGNCPHCRKKVEIQLKGNIKIKLVTEKDSLSPSIVIKAKLRNKL